MSLQNILKMIYIQAIFQVGNMFYEKSNNYRYYLIVITGLVLIFPHKCYNL